MVGELGIAPKPRVPKTRMPTITPFPEILLVSMINDLWLLPAGTVRQPTSIHTKLVEAGRVELPILGCRPSVFPLALYPHGGQCGARIHVSCASNRRYPISANRPLKSVIKNSLRVKLLFQW